MPLMVTVNFELAVAVFANYICVTGAGMKKARPKEYGQVKILSRKKEDTPELLPWTPLVDTELLKKQFPIPDIVDEGVFLCERYALIAICSLGMTPAPVTDRSCGDWLTHT